jgi:hypothetical protein
MRKGGVLCHPAPRRRGNHRRRQREECQDLSEAQWPELDDEGGCSWGRTDTIAGWHVRASRGIRVHDVVGDHLEIFRESLSQQIIASVIRRAQRDFVAK